MKTKLVFFTVVILLLGILCGCTQESQHERSTRKRAERDTSESALYSGQSETEAPPAAREDELYTDYLLNGEYEDLLYDYGDPDADYEAQAALADINEDGIRELLIHITDKASGGVRGFASVTALYGIRNGAVERLGYAYYGGGSGGGDYIFYKYDTAAQKHVLEYEEFVRDGMFFSTYALHYFDCSQIDTEQKNFGMTGDGNVVYKTAHTLRCDSFYTEGTYAEDAQRVLSESDLCKQEDGQVYAFTYDGSYISEAQYNALREQVVDPTDPAYQMKPVTLENPIPAD